VIKAPWTFCTSGLVPSSLFILGTNITVVDGSDHTLKLFQRPDFHSHAVNGKGENDLSRVLRQELLNGPSDRDPLASMVRGERFGTVAKLHPGV
jgi:hypothetical protein